MDFGNTQKNAREIHTNPDLKQFFPGTVFTMIP